MLHVEYVLSLRFALSLAAQSDHCFMLVLLFQTANQVADEFIEGFNYRKYTGSAPKLLKKFDTSSMIQ